jgi:hypothetical protein
MGTISPVSNFSAVNLVFIFSQESETYFQRVQQSSKFIFDQMQITLSSDDNSNALSISRA